VAVSCLDYPVPATAFQTPGTVFSATFDLLDTNTAGAGVPVYECASRGTGHVLIPWLPPAPNPFTAIESLENQIANQAVMIRALEDRLANTLDSSCD
jgi:hypothetical protein